MGVIVSWTYYSGIIEFDFDRPITIEAITHRVGNDTLRISEIVDDSVLRAAIEVAKQFGYTEIEFTGTTASFTGKLPSKEYVERVVKVFAAWFPLDLDIDISAGNDVDLLAWDDDDFRDVTPFALAHDIY